MAIKFSDKVFGANVEKKIIDIFDNLQKGSFDQKPLSQTAPTHQDYLGDRTPFARMWSANLISGSKRQEIVYNIVNDNRDESYVEINEPIGDVINKELTDNPYLKPKAGITSITSKTEGSLGAIKSTDVSFVVHNKRDFEDIFLPFFLKPGSTVVVDYGWSDKSFNPYDVSKTISNTDLELSKFKNDTYGGINTGPDKETLRKNSNGVYYYHPNEDITEPVVVVDEWRTVGYINDNLGLVDTLIGKVTDYNASVNQQGSFECSITLVSENTSLLDSEIAEENNLKFIFANKIEEIIIKTVSGIKEEDGPTIGNAELSYYDALGADDKQQVRENFYENLKLSGTTTGIIPPSAIKSGLFYQDVTDSGGGKKNDKDVLYISYGLFEDLFLNTLIAENRITDSPHRVNYNTKDTFVRYEANLVLRQKQILSSNEDLSLFLIPTNWTDSYNKTTKEEFELHNSKVNEYKTKIIPFRELFISVALISKTFSQKQNINDALVSIYDAINKDSYDVFKLKMISLNNSYSSISVQDVNLIPEPPEKINMLKFDVTSDKSIVSGLDYKFGMPKGGMASMIAIGEKDDFDIFDEKQSDNLNFLRILGPDKNLFGEDVHFKSLPIIKSKEDKPDKPQKTSYDFSQNKTKDIVAKMDISTVDNIRTNWVNSIKDLSKKKQESDSEKGIPVKSKNPIIVQEDETLLPSNSFRDYYGKMANRATVLGNKSTSVSPILPIELTLTIYGNTYLQIGDIFNINFLPDFYQDNIMFQILNIEQKVSSNWETTYSTVMRLRPNKKGKVSDTDLKKPVLSQTYTHNFITKKSDNNKAFLNAAKNLEPVEVVIDYITATKITVAYDQTTIALDDMAAELDVQGDARIIKIEFGYPQTQQDIAIIFAFQKTIAQYIFKEALHEKKTIVHVKKEGTKELDFGKKWTNAPLGFWDILITALVEDKDVLIAYRNAIKDFFDKATFPGKETGPKRLVDNLLKKMAKNKILNDFFDKYLYGWTGNKTITGVDSPYELKTVGDVVGSGNIDPKYGFLMSSIGFMFENEGRGEIDIGTGKVIEKEKEKRFVYAIDLETLPGMTNSVPLFLLPDWFFNRSGGVVDFCTDLDKNYYDTMVELKDIFTPDEGDAIQKRAREDAMAGGLY